jgi:phenylacetate-CoA ligase
MIKNPNEWPPQYDNDYFPSPQDRYWFKEMETMDPAKRDETILKKIRGQIAYAYERAPFYRKKWDEAGIHPEKVKSFEDFRKIPLVYKHEIREDQAKNPPFGSYLCLPREQVFRIHGSSGTTGKPTAFAIGRDDWDRIGNAHARIMWGFGLRSGDSVFIGSFFSLYLGSWGALAGAERLRLTCFPFGAGLPGQTLMALRWIKDMQPTAFYGTPSFALYLAERAREEGFDPLKDFNFKTMFFSGEPGAGIPATKKKIEESYGCKCIDLGTMAEMTPWMTNGECEFRTGMHLWLDIVYTELVDPETKKVVDYGKEGVPVYTHLERTSHPMIRLYSGDLATWTNEPCPCGRTYPRLPKGMYGRADDMFLVRGENVYPSGVEGALREVAGFGEEFRIIITREKTMDELLVQAEYSKEVAAKAQTNPQILEQLKREMEEKLKARIGVRGNVELVEYGKIERTQFKARRVIDKRDLYK